MSSDLPVAPKGSSVANLVESLIELGCEYAGSVSGHTGKFTCPNPGHTDGRASFDVRVGRNGNWYISAEGTRLLGDAADSPIVQKANQFGVMSGYTHRF